MEGEVNQNSKLLVRSKKKKTNETRKRVTEKGTLNTQNICLNIRELDLDLKQQIYTVYIKTNTNLKIESVFFVSFLLNIKRKRERTHKTILMLLFFNWYSLLHSMQGWIATKRHEVKRKRGTKRLKDTGNLFRKNLHLQGVSQKIKLVGCFHEIRKLV